MKVKNNWLKKLHRWLFSTLYVRYYHDLEELPIWNFAKCMAGEVCYVQVNGQSLSSRRAQSQWENMFNEYIKVYDLPDGYKTFLKKMTKACKLFAKVVAGEKWRVLQANILVAQARNAISGEGESIEITCARLSKFLGFPVNSRQTSVTQFYSYIQLMQNG